jgi:hypothetical protein
MPRITDSKTHNFYSIQQLFCLPSGSFAQDISLKILMVRLKISLADNNKSDTPPSSFALTVSHRVLMVHRKIAIVTNGQSAFPLEQL